VRESVSAAEATRLEGVGEFDGGRNQFAPGPCPTIGERVADSRPVERRLEPSEKLLHERCGCRKGVGYRTIV
jgi:hypothetical protein